jgi:hypothetical protein
LTRRRRGHGSRSGEKREGRGSAKGRQERKRKETHLLERDFRLLVFEVEVLLRVDVDTRRAVVVACHGRKRRVSSFRKEKRGKEKKDEPGVGMARARETRGRRARRRTMLASVDEAGVGVEGKCE